MRREINATLLALENSGAITPTDRRMAIPQDTALARFYGLPKVHKEGTPLRPIVSIKGAPTNGLATWLFQRLKFLTTESNTTVSSSAQFLEKFKGLLKFCFRTYFTFDGTVYKQVKGTPMGSPISEFIAEAVLQRLESLDFQHYRPKFCVRARVKRRKLAASPPSLGAKIVSEDIAGASRIPLPFVFKFFGYPTTNVTLATGGFLYMGDLLHDHLTYSQYIAPLMADFDTSLGRGLSHISYALSDNYFIAKWENVILKHCPNFYTFSFSVTLFKNGTIAFAYIQVPEIKLVDGRLVNCSRYSVGKTSSSRGSDNDLRASPTTKNASRFPVGDENERDIMEAPKAQRDVIVGVSDAYMHYPGGE
nr:unnamed protein product [Spirometra erinaceieuropaei]